MGDSSDSEEFYDAEEFTPNRGSKRSSLCKNINVLEMSLGEHRSSNSPPVSPDTPVSPQTTPPTLEDDKKTVTNVVEDRRRFLELRRTMQTEEDDDPNENPAALDHHTYTMEHPFKIIEHDAMSMQSMTSLGRIGRILSGAAESHPNIKENIPATVDTASSREPSMSDDLLSNGNRIQSACVEPDVIASTKANSVKCRGASVTSHAHTHSAPPRPPRRRKKRENLHGSQSLCTDTGSVCDSEFEAPRHNLVIEPNLSDILSPGQNALPSPASTIESITRELQDSLEQSNSKFASRDQLCGDSRVSSRSSTGGSSHTRTHAADLKAAVSGPYVVRPLDEDVSRPSPGDVRHSRAAVGHSSLGSSRSSAGVGVCVSGGRVRRRSAGDEVGAGGSGLARSASGHQLSDAQILDQVTVLNLDTGERMPLSVAEHKLPQCINPLSLHIMRLTSEYIGRTNDDENTSPKPKVSWRSRLSHRFSSTFNLTNPKIRHAQSDISFTTYRETDEESEAVPGAEAERVPAQPQDTKLKRGTAKIKRFLGTTVKKTVDAAKSLAQEVSHARHKEDVADIVDEVRGEHYIKLKASNSHKGPYDFDGCIRHVQEMSGVHTGAVWCVRFSVCGRLLATAGQDRLLRVWATRDSSQVFQEMRAKYNVVSQSSPTPSCESLPLPPPPPLPPAAPFCPRPFAVYRGHTSDLLDLSWSKNYFLLSSSMDKTVRLWHISRAECLCCFQHIDFVTAIVFHPKDDRYFLSGSLDGKLRLWNIPDKKVAVWNEVEGKSKLITAANFCQNGKFAVVGTYDGRCIFYTTDQLKYHTQIEVKSTRGKNSTGRKISGVEPMPNDDKILVTSNDSRIRLYDLRDLNLSCKYKGYVNVSSQIKASFSHDGKYIVSGSENQCIYIWNTYHDYSKFTSVRRDRNHFWEGIKAHNAVVTCAVFAPNPDQLIRAIVQRERDGDTQPLPEEGGMVSSSQSGHVLVSADFNGCIRVFVHRAKPKHSSLPASALA